MFCFYVVFSCFLIFNVVLLFVVYARVCVVFFQVVIDDAQFLDKDSWTLALAVATGEQLTAVHSSNSNTISSHNTINY